MLNSVGERMSPCGRPFLILIVRNFLFLYCICAVLPDRKFDIHFLWFGGILVFMIFCMRMCLGTVSNALFMSIAVRMVLWVGF